MMRGPAMSWFESGMLLASVLSQSSAPCVMLECIGLPSVLSDVAQVSGYLSWSQK